MSVGHLFKDGLHFQDFLLCIHFFSGLMPRSPCTCILLVFAAQKNKVYNSHDDKDT